ncbi:hypothetical protein [Halorubrum lacusprofundi]|jgi:hypothetical protein|uniref:Uncharacterized protein n=1 Tax=Halorubrum lacusprofundi (strain ATCC 49239 / DSM 5036 / JCM 8891 / ACAM 34) TaxID=416348 RepID=B9LTV7_HALLT|nr:hypothetical protein [Halorubrum lacusprofundi]ACM56241.1 hypothetical protein Hlac_0639 [Halorubrum lacusprofundi ATCC 49239]MCG1005451.1 hypothetical protein [Halorubrum lacusprofundi]
MPSEPPPDPDPSPADDTQSRRQRVGQYVALGAVCAYAAVQFYGADPRPWGLAAGWAAATAVILGPAAWVARDRLPPDRLETLTYVAFGAAILAIPVGLGAALAFEVPFFPYGPGFLVGVALGTLVVFLAERTVVPERLRGAGI